MITWKTWQCLCGMNRTSWSIRPQSFVHYKAFIGPENNTSDPLEQNQDLWGFCLHNPSMLSLDALVSQSTTHRPLNMTTATRGSRNHRVNLNNESQDSAKAGPLEIVLLPLSKITNDLTSEKERTIYSPLRISFEALSDIILVSEPNTSVTTGVVHAD